MAFLSYGSAMKGDKESFLNRHFIILKRRLVTASLLTRQVGRTPKGLRATVVDNLVVNLYSA